VLMNRELVNEIDLGALAKEEKMERKSLGW
jgi:hypothetical protein